MSAVRTPIAHPHAPARSQTMGQYTRDYVGRLRGGELGSLPAILGLLALCVGFGIFGQNFLTRGNFANLFNQGAQVTIIAMGLVFVLLLGEIDLSAGFASGLCATIMTVLLTEHHVVWYLAILAAIGTGMLIGLTIGLLRAKVGIPSFVVTLAAFLAFQGVQLLFLSGGKNITIFDPVVRAINSRNMPVWLGWLMYLVAVVGYGASQLLRWRGRLRRNLVTEPLALPITRIALLAVLGGAAVYVLNLNRALNTNFTLQGVPIIVPIIGVLLVFWSFVLRRTRYGRHMYALGGNEEAARRAGIPIDRLRISAFVICSSMAAIGGIADASRASSVAPASGGNTTLLYAVGAAVIGGTSLFGGKGRIADAVWGGAVIAVIGNGMTLIPAVRSNAGIQYIVTGLFLLLAAGVDALSRRRAAASNR